MKILCVDEISNRILLHEIVGIMSRNGGIYIVQDKDYYSK